jgi:uncharacterized protein
MAVMQLSRFVVAYRSVRPAEHVLYSVLSDRYLGVDAATLDGIDRWSRGLSPGNSAERDTQDALLEDGFLVHDRAEDDERLREYLDRASDGVPGQMHVTLMPTLACNLACDYCFQKEHPAFGKMHAQTEDATVEWILRAIDERKLRTLHVHYFGGEPLTRKDFLLRTAEILSSAMAARGGTFEWSCTTNGIGLTPEFAQRMRNFGDGIFKVTLDGDRETHDRMRTYRDGRGSFDQIFANVVACASVVRIRVGGNFLPDQQASFEKLLDRLDSAGLRGKLESVRFKPIIDTQRKKASCTGCDGHAETTTLVQLNRSIERRGLGPREHREETLEEMLGPCELHWKNNYTIDPDGRVYKCPAVAGIPGMEVASVVAREEPAAAASPGAEAGPRPVAGAEKVAPLLVLRPWQKCGDCPYLPVCMGGCLGGKYLKTGRTDEVACKLEAFEASFREAVTKRYLAEFGSTEEWSHAA